MTSEGPGGRRRRDDTMTLTSIHRRRAMVPSLTLVATSTLPAPSPTIEIRTPLGLASVVLGTDPDCELVVSDPAVSRRHCSFSLTSEGVVVRDLGSKNGTTIGGIEIREGLLPATSFVRAGNFTVRVRAEGAPTEIALSSGARFGSVLGGSIAMRALFERLQQGAASDATILLVGEAGTGKELLARAVHDESPRRDGPFVVFDAGGVSPALVESELFGHLRGAFTGATDDRAGVLVAANGGTIFIDEIGELPLDLQPRLLRAIETRQIKPVGSNQWHSFDARIVAATNRDLRAAVAAGTFRDDLFYRIAVIAARVPPLRERMDDLELLVEHFLAAEVPPRTVLDLAPGAMAMLAGHAWPGNVRELRNALARLAVFPGELEGALELGGVEGEARAGGDALLAMPWREARDRVLDRFEGTFLRAKLREHEGNTARTAAAMGISRQMVYRLMTRHGIRAGEPEE